MTLRFTRSTTRVTITSIRRLTIKRHNRVIRLLQVHITRRSKRGQGTLTIKHVLLLRLIGLHHIQLPINRRHSHRHMVITIKQRVLRHSFRHVMSIHVTVYRLVFTNNRRNHNLLTLHSLHRFHTTIRKSRRISIIVTQLSVQNTYLVNIRNHLRANRNATFTLT